MGSTLELESRTMCDALPRTLRRAVGPLMLLVPVTIFSSAQARAKEVEDTKRQCVEAADQGQLLRDSGKYSAARGQFAQCSDDACPVLVRENCAEWMRRLMDSTPSVVFAATDGKGRDLTGVSVRVDGRAVAERLDGRPIDLDPGPHEVEFAAQGHRAAGVNVMLRAGEKNRTVLANLPEWPAAVRERESPVQASTGSFWNGRAIASLSFIAAGAVSAGAGAYFAVASRDEADRAARLRKDIGQGGCTQPNSPACASLRGDVDAQRRDFVASGVLYALAGALAAAALANWFAWPQKRDAPAAKARFAFAPRIAPGSAVLSAEMTLP